MELPCKLLSTIRLGDSATNRNTMQYFPVRFNPWNKTLNKPDKSDTPSSTPELITKYGYPFETHADLPTEDGYLLKMYRIPRGRSENSGTRPPVLLMHGLFGSSSDYLLVGPKDGLGFLLADQGYDVWLANARGNTYSSKHVYLNSETDDAYWEFTWHEIGMYDLPAMFTHILNVTQQPKLFYIGLSQGTTAFYVLTSQKPWYNNYVSLMVALAPITSLEHIYSPVLKSLARIELLITKLVKTVGISRFPPQSMEEVLRLWYFGLTEVLYKARLMLWYLLVGDGSPQLNKKYLPVIFANFPNQSSIWQLRHFGQIVNSKRFMHYDHGPSGNRIRYGTMEPPSYDLSKITAPVALFYSASDWICREEDVEKLGKVLPNCVYKYQVPTRQFNHCDFIVAKDVYNLLYKEIIMVLEKYR